METLAAWISVREAARILGISHNTLRKMIDDGEVSVVGTVGKRKLIVLDRTHIEWVAKRKLAAKAA